MDTINAYAVEYCRPVEDAVSDRYGEGHGISTPENPVIDHMLMHRTIRRFTSDPVAEDDVRTAIAAAQSAATSSHLQSWSVVKISDPAHKREVNALCGNQGQIEAAPLMLVWLSDQSRNHAIGGEEAVPREGFEYFEASLLGIVDSCIAAQNAALAFEALGYGTCYIGAVRNNAAKLATLLNLPDRCFPVTGLVVGRPDPSHDTDIKPRLRQEVVVHDETYRTADFDEIRAYNRVMNEFQEKQRLSPVDWSNKVAVRLSGKSSLHGRDRYMEYLRSVNAGSL
ncbi:nitroreductase family protein [Neorhizobium vignae]|uniref:nitroreductase family protein n=1 Tax=Neorhizobium vignae TaxID=690585 RepID=UPI00068B0A15|nr:nitroreductase family protein [Neorhizobium vignae]